MRLNSLKLLPTLLLTFTVFFAFSQDEVKWSFSYNSDASCALFSAELKDGWHLYSQFIDEDLGPIPTTFDFLDNANLSRIELVKESNVKTVYDENFGGDLGILEGKAIFSQQILVKESTILKGTVLYMVCNDKGCLPPGVEEFEIEIN